MKRARVILPITVRRYWDLHQIPDGTHHYIHEGQRVEVDISGRAILSGTPSEPVEWLTEIEHRIVACADREERSARFLPDHTRICREVDGRLSWDGASAYKPHPGLKTTEP